MTENKLTKAGQKNERSIIENYDICNMDEAFALANDLTHFIKENKLYQNIQGKEYVNVEAWQYAGARLGIMPVVESLIALNSGDEIKYQSQVGLLNLRDEKMVGRGYAICSNKEPGKKYYQEYAIASMAQTRAIGKAYRNLLAWIIRAAGYEPTPSEEMEPMADILEKKLHTYLEQEKPIKMAGLREKEELIKLLNNNHITDEEKNKMLLSLDTLDDERIQKAIARLKKTIKARSAA